MNELLDGGFHEDRLRALMFIGNVDRATYCTRPMHHARGYDHALPLCERYLRSVLKFNLELALHNKKQFVRVRVVMPTIFPLKYRKSHALFVDI